MELLDRVKALCKSKGISLGAMEKEMGISNGASYKWKNSSPSMEMLKKLSSYFGVSIDYLSTGQEKENDQKYYINNETEEMAQEIYQQDKVVFDAYRSAHKDRLIAYAQKLMELEKMEKGDLE